MADEPKDLSDLNPATAKVGDLVSARVVGLDTAVSLISDNAFTFQQGAFAEVILIATQTDQINPILKISKIEGSVVSFEAGPPQVKVAQRAVARLRMDATATINLANNLRNFVREKLADRSGELLP